MRIEKFWGETGWDWSIGPSRAIRTWLAIWWTTGIDCGVAISNREVRFNLERRA